MPLHAAGTLLFFLCWLSVPAAQSDTPSIAHFRELADQHPDKTGVYVLEKGEESLLARAWLTDNATRTIDIQYFIWSTDNIGILASEALLRAAERGVRVTIQTPYVVLTDEAILLFAGLVRRGVQVRIVTNSLASTDNLQAYSGYHKKRDALLAAGIELHEFRPYPMVQYRLNERHAELKQHNPVF